MVFDGGFTLVSELVDWLNLGKEALVPSQAVDVLLIGKGPVSQEVLALQFVARGHGLEVGRHLSGVGLLKIDAMMFTRRWELADREYVIERLEGARLLVLYFGH